MTRTLPRGVADDYDLDEFPLGALDDDALRGALSHWHRVMGTEWFGTPGTAGADALESRIKACRTWRAAWKSPGPPETRAAETAYHSRHFDRRADSKAPFLHGLDVTRMYPTAAGVTDVAVGRLSHSGPLAFDKSRAGWWLLDISPWCWAEMPDPAGYASRLHTPGAPRWVTTPTAKLLADLQDEGAHAGFTVLDSWTGPGRPIFRDWNQALEKLYREAETPELRTAVKSAGRQTLGLLNSKTYSTYRPDWHYAVISQARSNLWRKCWKVYGNQQITPLMVDTDCVWLGGDSADPTSALPEGWKLGDTPGAFKVKGTVAR